MAIVINGSGSITGISAGGLPDGSVTAADIESSLDLSGKTVTLPSGTGGKVLQVKKVLLSSTQTVATTAWTGVTNASLTITPMSTTSTMFVNGSVHTYISGGSSWHSTVLRILRDSIDLGGWKTTDPYMQGNLNNSESMHQPIVYRTDAIGDTNSHTYTLQAYSKNNYSSRLNDFSSGWFEIMEIEL